jgi:hypothetical protein
VNDEEVEKDLDKAGTAIQTFAPGGLWGLAIGGALALMAIAAGAVRRAWRRRLFNR